MRVIMSTPVAGMAGSVGNSTVVFRYDPETGAVFARAKTRPCQPNTYDQELARRVARDATRHWTGLTEAEREAWTAFAAYVSAGGRKRRALDICRESARRLLLLGLQPRRIAPEAGFPERVREVSLERTETPDELCLRVFHGVAAPQGHVSVVRMTPEAPGASAPRPEQLRCICGLGPHSAAVLPPSGGLVTFRGVRFTIAPARRFGVEITVVRLEDGLASEPVFARLTRPPG